MRYDHFSMLPEKAFQPRNGRQGMTLEGGGGGGGPQTNTTYTSNIPEWLRPQTEALLGAATQEYFNVDPSGQIRSIKPYRPFSENKEAYFAPFNQQQQNIFGEVGQMTTSPLYGSGAALAGQAGVSALGYGQQAAGMGGMYERMATSPMSMQAYMSPYMQQVVERQKLAAIEDAQRANLGQNLAAARQGTYGGARQALMEAQREAALEKQLGDIQAGGLQSAFERAQQAQQFGVQTGLQGLGVGLQGLGTAGQMGSQLADIAGARQAADVQRIGLQSEIGAQQQAREQAIIDQRIQDFALAEQYPYQQLSAYSGLLRGYSTPTTSVSQYRAAQSPITQLAGTGIQLGGAAQALGMGGGRRAGGQIKSYAEGGITSVDALERTAEKASIPQLQQSMRNDTLPEYIGMPILLNKVDNAERMQMAQGIAPDMGQQVPIADKVMQRANALQGINSVQTAAGGGMVAFNNGGVARFQNQGIVLGEPEVTQEMLEEERKRQEMFLGVDPRIAKTKELLGKQGQESGLDRAMRGLQYVVAGEKIKREGDTSQLEKITQSEMARRKEMADRQMKLAELEGADYQQRAGIYKDVTGRQREKAKTAADQAFRAGESALDRKNRLAVASMPGEKERIAKQLQANAAANGEQISMEDALSRTTKALTSPPDRYNALSNRLIQARKEFGTASFALQNQLAAAKTDAERATIRQKLKDLEQEIYRGNSISPADLAELQEAGRVSSGAQPAAPRAAPAAGRFSVTAPDGTTFNFPTQQAADEFRRRIQGQ